MRDIIFIIIFSILISVTSMAYHKWRCDRMGMDFDYLGCIVRK